MQDDHWACFAGKNPERNVSSFVYEIALGDGPKNDMYFCSAGHIFTHIAIWNEYHKMAQQALYHIIFLSQVPTHHGFYVIICDYILFLL